MWCTSGLASSQKLLDENLFLFYVLAQFTQMPLNRALGISGLIKARSCWSFQKPHMLSTVVWGQGWQKIFLKIKIEFLSFFSKKSFMHGGKEKFGEYFLYLEYVELSFPILTPKIPSIFLTNFCSF
jgi:hypothetical protein